FALPALLLAAALDLKNGRDVPLVLACAGVGFALGTFLLIRWVLRRHARTTVDQRPAAFNRVECLLGFWLADGESTGQTNGALASADGPEDEEPRPLLSEPRKPGLTLLRAELSVPLQVDEEGQWHYPRGWPVVRLALVLLALPLPVVGWLVL